MIYCGASEAKHYVGITLTVACHALLFAGATCILWNTGDY